MILEGYLSFKDKRLNIDLEDVVNLPELPDDFSESKDWKHGSYSERVEWLLIMVKSYRRQIDMLDSTIDKLITNKE